MRLENYCERGKAIHCSAMTRSRHLLAGRCHKQAAAHNPHRPPVGCCEEGYLWGQQGPRSLPDK
ncbi:hypothetical protein E2C01_032916 [Portunus trituberculatus]|uniref:Uncharacterized protein n=1 Tax=Portunus trituberculatus TaxID=210409 RepID=A0A5B7EX63_PORTR|nr:hypothetical protein [Portunus trituberculatus]